MNPIDAPGIPLAQPHIAVGESTTPAKEAVTTDNAFADMLGSVVASANTRAQVAQTKAEEFAAGQSEDIHGTMLALSQADIELRFVGNVRNKIVDAFYEMWRMQI